MESQPQNPEFKKFCQIQYFEAGQLQNHEVRNNLKTFTHAFSQMLASRIFLSFRPLVESV